MSDTYKKLQYGNNYNHWKILDVVANLNYISFSDLNPTPVIEFWDVSRDPFFGVLVSSQSRRISVSSSSSRDFA